MALREHAASQQQNKSKDSKPYYDEAMSTFFRNVDTRFDDLPNIPYDPNIPKKQQEIRGLKARAVLIDMETGVLDQLLRDKNLGQLFDERALVSDVSGSGNNWAHGHEIYGPKYEENILESVRRNVEYCDSLQCFFFIHSLGGGTGSGLGTYVLQLLADEYPDVYRFTSAVFPSEDDDVITSPYNSVLATRELIEFADCVLPIENQALFDMCESIQKIKQKQRTFKPNEVIGNTIVDSNEVPLYEKSNKKKAFEHMNTIAANLLTNLTSSMRFEGNLNIDLNEITMNLVPYPKLHFLLSSLSPLVLPKDVYLPTRRLDQMFLDAFSKDYQLMKVDPKHSKYLACGLMVRGNVQISDLNRNISKLKNEIDFVYWNQEGFKIGLCNVPPIGQPYSLLTLANNCCIANRFQDMKARFNRLFKKRAHVHHFTQYMEPSRFEEAVYHLEELTQEYEGLMNATPPQQNVRFIPE